MFISRMHAACFIILIFIAPALANSAQDITEEPERLTCTYPVSGQDGLLPRVLYYVSFVVAIAARRHEWLAGAALGFVMNCSSMAILHLLIIHETQYAFPRVLDLYFYPIKVIISTAFSFSMIVCFSNTISRSRARPIIVTWIAWVSSAPDKDILELACFTPNNSSTTGMTPLISLDQLSSPGGLSFNCTFQCFSSRSPIRNPEEIIVITRGAMPKIINTTFLVLFCVWGLATGFYIGYRTESDREAAGFMEIIRRHVNRRVYGVKFLSPQYFLPSGGVVLMVISERYLLDSLPQGEEMHAVGQWALVVGATFILLAVLFDKYLADACREIAVKIGIKARKLYLRTRGERERWPGLLGGQNSVDYVLELLLGLLQDIDAEAMGEEVGNG